MAKRHHNAIFKNRDQNIERSFGCVARRVVLLKSNVANILLFNFRQQKFGSIMIAIDGNGLSLLIFEGKWPNYATGPKSAPNSNSFWVFNVCVRVFCAPNTTILPVYIPAKIKMSFIWKDDFCASSVSRYSFGGRIKLIIRQIRHKLSVTIQKISTGWKKKLDGGPYISYLILNKFKSEFFLFFQFEQVRPIVQNYV